MEVTVHLPDVLSGHQRGKAARGLLRVVSGRCNRPLIQRGLLPPLYESGVVYGAEVGFEEFADAHTCFARQVGDCDDLAAWRLAELQEEHARALVRGERNRLSPWPDVQLVSKPINGEQVLVHVLVRDWDGTVEDPSRVLGMP